MSYYAHERHRGGFFKSLGKAVSDVGKFVGKATSYASNPIGALSTGISKLAAPKRPRVQETQFGSIKGGVLVPTKTDIAAGVYRMVDSGLAGLLPGGAPPFYQQGEQVVCPPGYHPNKQGGPKGAAGTYCVRNRRMNPANGRAIGRSIRRIKGGMKQARQLFTLLTPGKKGRLAIRKRGK